MTYESRSFGEFYAMSLTGHMSLGRLQKKFVRVVHSTSANYSIFQFRFHISLVTRVLMNTYTDQHVRFIRNDL